MDPITVRGITFRLTRHRGVYVVSYTDAGGDRRRRSLGTTDPQEARARFGRHVEGLRAATSTHSRMTGDLWATYVAGRREAGKSTERMENAWKRLKGTYERLHAADVTVAVSKGYNTARLAAGAHPGTVWSELVYLRACYNHAHRVGILDRKVHVHMPHKPDPKDRSLTRAEARRLLDGAASPHIRLFIVLALTTAGRAGAILDLTWDRVDLDGGTIDLYDPQLARTRKGRARVPINDLARDELDAARVGALSPYVVEYAGRQVVSVKKGVAAAARRSGVPCSPHVFRHTAAVWMAGARVPMTEIAQVLGHRDSRTTERVYARFTPGFLSDAMAALNF